MAKPRLAFAFGLTAVMSMALTAIDLSPADAQRRAGARPAPKAKAPPRGGGNRTSHQASNRAGRGQAKQNHQVRSDAHRNVNHNRDHNRNRNRNVNVNRDLNVDVDVHHDHHGYYNDWGDHYHPIATAAVTTAAIATTAAVIGSITRSIPPDCVTVYRGSAAYYQCGNTWFQPTYVGSDVQYVVVSPP